MKACIMRNSWGEPSILHVVYILLSDLNPSQRSLDTWIKKKIIKYEWSDLVVHTI